MTAFLGFGKECETSGLITGASVLHANLSKLFGNFVKTACAALPKKHPSWTQ